MPGRRTILMVEDEESITVPLAEALAREGFDTEVAGTASEALELARRVNPDLVLLDVMLPDGSGYDVCRALRADSRVPIIMLTLAARRPIGWSDSSSEPTTTSSSRSAPARWPPGSGRSFAVRVGRRPSPATAPSSSASSGSIPAGARRASPERTWTSRARSSSSSSCSCARRAPWSRASASSTRSGTSTGSAPRRRSTFTFPALRQKLGDDPATPRFIHTVRGVGFRCSDPEELESGSAR